MAQSIKLKGLIEGLGLIEGYERERMQRISFILGTAFLQFRLATWHMSISSIEAAAENKQILITEDNNKTSRWNGWWLPFPSELPYMDDARNKAAVLTTMACYDTGCMSLLATQLVEGLEILLEEVVLRRKSYNRSTTVRFTNNLMDLNDHDFWVIRATSHLTGQQWTMHLTGAQYNIHNEWCGMPWADFCKIHVHRILAIKPFGTLHKYAKTIAQTKTVKGMETDVQLQAVQAFHDAVDPAMKKKGLVWSNILFKNDDDFARHTEKILRVGNKAVQKYVETTQLTKRRQKAERYEKRHREEVAAEEKKICEEVLGYQPQFFERVVSGVTWRMSDHLPPASEGLQEGVEVLKDESAENVEDN
ncbi:hypothetical protein BDU57DRAFT_6225 [Ampelomyces quisqualis]|uniref:Uncharacterized protein n=1 Tax=Ampelomyces quisqualis TaxID=50730 RepID=A0A6A5QXN6_AMPQU|nr:hypothetical protein BDU57DRAFT_6225 [Ampelomyces quisqualis]